MRRALPWSWVAALAALSCTPASQPPPRHSPAARAAAPRAEDAEARGHRLVSIATELAYGQSITGFPYTGYGYQPVAHGGPDQLYQLQAIDHFEDSITTSALLMIYPLALATRDGPCLNGTFHLLCTAGLLSLGFGPTFLQGGSAVFADQWNLRLGLEVVPDVLLLTGPSWRSMRVSSVPEAQLGSIVSVPQPASTPTLATVARADLQWSVGIAVDLAALSDLLGALSLAVTGREAKP